MLNSGDCLQEKRTTAGAEDSADRPTYPPSTATVTGNADHWASSPPATAPSVAFSGSTAFRTSGYTGLVNQAMTCYLNSLLQTLFMTPEFRNAMYNWEWTGCKGDDSKSIPFQLQKLFLLLQTSEKSALETKELTKSFGWDSSHAWDQHDVQELCRVMFDALENTWRKTCRPKLINELYQGKLTDYVKCLQCQHENARADVFLDLPLAVKAFGCPRAFPTIFEALRAFVNPEILDGPNQYFCTHCGKKCDAHKGLKITKFPYLLTIQLKRFDFDYNTMHRIKLNDRMTFPGILNLNPFVDGDRTCDGPVVAVASVSKHSDDHRNHGRVGFARLAVPRQIGGDELHAGFAQTASDDEGICLENGGANNGGSNATTSPAESDELDADLLNEKADSPVVKGYLAEGPYVYELFSIMVHSGSANGGHYYAYIKNLDKNVWYCFNDQVVTRASIEDVRKTYGGSSGSNFLYSHSSSTNAYMLMYRQIDHARNEAFTRNDKLPAHLMNILEKLNLDDLAKKRDEEYQKSFIHYTVYYYHPETGALLKGEVQILKTSTIGQYVEKCHRQFDLASMGVPVDRCRLVRFTSRESIENSFDDVDAANKNIKDIIEYSFVDLLLEIRPAHLDHFRAYRSHGHTAHVHPVEMDSSGRGVVGHYFIFYVDQNCSVGEFKNLLIEYKNWGNRKLTVIFDRPGNNLRIFDVPSKRLTDEVGPMMGTFDVYVATEPADLESTAMECNSNEQNSATSRQISCVDGDVSSLLLGVIQRHKNQMSFKVFMPTARQCDEHFFGSNGQPSADVDSVDDEDDDGHNCADEGRAANAEEASADGDAESNADSTTAVAVDLQPPTPRTHPSPRLGGVCGRFVAGRRSVLTADVVPPQTTTSLPSVTQGLAECETLAASNSQTRLDEVEIMAIDEAMDAPSFDDFGVLSSPLSPSLSMDPATPSPRVSSDRSPSGDGNVDVAAEAPSIDLVGYSLQSTISPCYDGFANSSKDGASVATHKPMSINTAPSTDGGSSDDLSIENDFDLEYEECSDETQQLCRVNCDGRMTLGAFKVKLARFVGAKPDQFKVAKVYCNNSEYSWDNTNDCMKDAVGVSSLRVKLGRVLKDHEYLVKLYMFDLAELKTDEYLADFVVCKADSFAQIKMRVKKLLKRKKNINVTVDRIRFRYLGFSRVDVIKNGQSFFDKMGDWTPPDIYVQILSDSDPIDKNFTLLFIREWRPASISYGTLKELRLPLDNTYKSLFEKISEISGIKPDCLEITAPSDASSFPFEYPKLKLLEEIAFYACDKHLRERLVSGNPINLQYAGNLVYYRDTTEKAKELCEEERKEMQIKDSVRFRKMSSFSSRKERALKIYTEMSSSIKDEDMD